jgi:hypothetical protein
VGGYQELDKKKNKRINPFDRPRGTEDIKKKIKEMCANSNFI